MTNLRSTEFSTIVQQQQRILISVCDIYISPPICHRLKLY